MVRPGEWTRESVEELAREFDVTVPMFEPADVFCKGIVGYREDCGLVYEFGLLADALAQSYVDGNLKSEAPRSDYGHEEAYEDAVEWLEVNTLRTIPYMPEPRPEVIYGGEAYVG